MPEFLHNPVNLVLLIRHRRRNYDKREAQQLAPTGEGGDLNGKPQQEEVEIPELGEADNPDRVDLGESDYLDP
jgi:hypothetical protein